MSDKNKKDARDKETNKETNIQVCLRCRPKNGRESSEVPVIECFPERREITVAPNSGDKNASKTFTFDRVFGPDAAQAHIYEEVVRPLIEEVITGYNCTIFAYGQTGTGKTFTMEGSNWDDTDVSIVDNPGAGIIPRALHSLFEILDRQTSEYTVRLSHVELYNEELKDLLSAEDDMQRLRIFDDPKGGSALHGVVEDLVKDASDVIKVMQKGTSKRKVAATSLNQNSSRSHSVFSITVHIKESTPEGEDLLKVGKLNLVDLAGSENIRRSGAENLRAREAGKINQSLLTLGRVINALVEKSPHVPYRESKLTRLLQDSLGGKTKTCIIATISPAKGSLEETLSTLDYAHRAKNIRNRPEVNQRMTKKALIQEYISEIDRLRRDLMASQAKNGIFLDPENFQEMQDLIKSQKEQLESKILEMQSLEGIFDITRKDLENTAKDLRQTKGTLETTTKNLIETEKVLQEKAQKLHEQEYITSEHVQTEEQLANVASSLLNTVSATVSDLDGLHSKLERKRRVEELNFDTLRRFREEMYTKTGGMESQVSEFKELQAEMFANLIGAMKAFNETKAKDFDNTQKLLQSISQQLSSSLHASSTHVNQALQSHSESLSALANLSGESQEKARQESQEWKNSIEASISDLTSNLSQHRQEHIAWQHQLDGQFAQFFTLTQSFGEAQKKRLRSMNTFVQEHTAQQLKNLEAQRFAAQKNQQAQQQEMDAMKTQVMSDFAKILDAHMGTYQRSVHAAHGSLDASMASAIEYSSGFAPAFQERLQGSLSELERHTAQAEILVKSARENATSTAHNTTISSLADQADAIKAAENERIDRLVQILDSGAGKSASVISQAKASEAGFCAVLGETFNRTAEGAASRFKAASAQLETMNRNYSQTCLEVGETLEQGVANSQGFTQSETDQIHALQGQISRLVDHQIQFDQTTNKTPKKKAFEYPKNWRRTRDHDDILLTLRTQLSFDDSSSPSENTPTPTTATSQDVDMEVEQEPSQENPPPKEVKKSFLPVPTTKSSGIPKPVVLGAKN